MIAPGRTAPVISRYFFLAPGKYPRILTGNPMEADPFIAAALNSQEMLLLLILLALLGLGLASLAIFLLPRGTHVTPKPESALPLAEATKPKPPPSGSPASDEVEAFRRYADAAFAEAAARLECLYVKCHQCGQVARPIRSANDRYKCSGCLRVFGGPPFQFNAKDFPSPMLPDAFDHYLPPAALDDAVAWRARFAVEEKLLKRFKVGEQSFEDYWQFHVTDRLEALVG